MKTNANLFLLGGFLLGHALDNPVLVGVRRGRHVPVVLRLLLQSLPRPLQHGKAASGCAGANTAIAKSAAGVGPGRRVETERDSQWALASAAVAVADDALDGRRSLTDGLRHHGRLVARGDCGRVVLVASSSGGGSRSHHVVDFALVLGEEVLLHHVLLPLLLGRLLVQPVVALALLLAKLDPLRPGDVFDAPDDFPVLGGRDRVVGAADLEILPTLVVVDAVSPEDLKRLMRNGRWLSLPLGFGLTC